MTVAALAVYSVILLFFHFFWAILLFIVGNIAARLGYEFIMMLFSMHRTLRSIDRKMPEPQPFEQPAPAPQPAPTPAPAPTPSAPSQSVDGGSVVSRAYSKLGYAYSWGGIGPNSFDCSGFVSYCLTGRYCRLGTTVDFMGWTRVSDPQPGDVVVNSYHTGIYIGNGQMIHASDYKTGVIISSVAAGMNNNYIFVRY